MALSSQRMAEHTPQNMRKRKKRGLKRWARLRPNKTQKKLQPRIYQSQIRFISALQAFDFTTLSPDVYAYLDQDEALTTALLSSIEHIASLYPQAQFILDAHFQDELVEIDLNVRSQDYTDPAFFSTLDEQSRYFIENWNHAHLNVYVDSDLHRVQSVSS